MPNFVYSVMSGKNDPMFGKWEHPETVEEVAQAAKKK